MTDFRFTILGPVQAKGRARSVCIGKYVRHYTPEKTASYESTVRAIASLEMESRGVRRFTMGVAVDLRFFLRAPKSVSRKRRAAMLSGQERPAKRPDIDNLAKAVLDGMNGVVYVDDAQIIRLTAEKRYEDEQGERCEVRVYSFDTRMER